MKPSKIIIFCFLAFLAPVLLAALIVPDFFFSSSEKNSSDPSAIEENPLENKNQATENNPPSQPTQETLANDASKSFVEVPSGAEFDLRKEGVFVLSLKFALAELPKEGEGIRLFTKYDEVKWPHVGWGLKVKRQAGTIRPEVYWMGSNGRGGWYSFGEIDLKEGHWSSISLVVERNNSISLFFQDLSTEADSTGISLPKFVGGFTVAEIPIPKNEGMLKILAPVSSKISDKAAIHDLLIARFKQLDGTILQLINGGPSEFAQKIKSDNITLWIDARGRDRSSFARKVIRTF